MALKWKSIVTYGTPTLPFPSTQLVKEQVELQCDQWQAQGLYSGNIDGGPNPDGPPFTRTWHRYWWATEAVANEYSDLVKLLFGASEELKNLSLVISIESEEVPD